MRILRPVVYHYLLAACLVLVASSLAIAASTMEEEFKGKRQGPFEFAEKPELTVDGDRVTIRFETKALCDVTVVIEDACASRKLCSSIYYWPYGGMPIFSGAALQHRFMPSESARR